MAAKGKLLEKNWISSKTVRNNAIRTKYIEANINNMQQKSNCRLFDERNETSEFNKIVQKEYETRHDWVGKEIHWELCKRLKFDYTSKW